VPSGRLLVTAPATFGRIHVGPLMAAYLKRHTEVSGELMLSDRIANLVEEGIDLAVRIGDLDDSSLIARRAGATRRVLVGSPAYLARRGVPRHPEELRSHDTITFGGESVAWRFIVDGMEQRVMVASRYTTNSADSAVWYAAEGGGLAMVLAYQAADALEERRLQVVLAEFERPALPIQFVYPASRLLSAKVRAFVDLALATSRWEFG
jgi:DNA-binding transcriptional LysR family regulator